MKALKITQKPQNGVLVIQLPDEFRKYELIEITVQPYERPTRKEQKIDVRKLRGSIKLNMTVEEIEEECRKMRSEWNRGF